VILDDILEGATGVIHCGANYGQERDIYGRRGLNVLWFEPIPWVFDELQRNLGSFPKQKAYRYAILDEDDKECPFYITDNEYQSSSALEPHLLLIRWTDVHYLKTIQVRSITLDTFFEREKIDNSRYQVLVLDTQGSELKALNGATELLPHIKFAEIESLNFEAYKGAAFTADIQAFMKENGFKEIGQDGPNFFYRRV
jgi:FkbM family methyltransferase